MDGSRIDRNQSLAFFGSRRVLSERCAFGIEFG
jgi:hypothetical protein